MIVKVSPFFVPFSQFSKVFTDDSCKSINKIFDDNGDFSNDPSSIFPLIVSSYALF